MDKHNQLKKINRSGIATVSPTECSCGSPAETAFTFLDGSSEIMCEECLEICKQNTLDAIDEYKTMKELEHWGKLCGRK